MEGGFFRKVVLSIALISMLGGCLIEEPMTVEAVSAVPGGVEIAAWFGGDNRIAGLKKRWNSIDPTLFVEPCRVAYSDAWEPELLFVQSIVREGPAGSREFAESWKLESTVKGLVVKVTGQVRCDRHYTGASYDAEPEEIDWAQACVKANLYDYNGYKVLAISAPGDLSAIADICAAQG